MRRISAHPARGDWSGGWTGRYISGGTVPGEAAGDLYGRAPGVFCHDIEVSRRAGRMTLIDGETYTDTNFCDVAGRYFCARVSYDFWRASCGIALAAREKIDAQG